MKNIQLRDYITLAPNKNQREVWQMYDVLKFRYKENHRFYHTLQHIENGLNQFQCYVGDTISPILFFAWAYHDVVYDPKAKDNEYQSAQFFLLHGEYLGFHEVEQEEIVRRIMTTTHKDEKDRNIITDIDLAGLGDPWDLYWLSNRRIREEYNFLSDQEWREGRLKFIESFLERGDIFAEQKFKDAYEKKASSNLLQEYMQLKY